MARQVTYYTASVNGQSQTQTSPFKWQSGYQGPNYVLIQNRQYYNSNTGDDSGKEVTGTRGVFLTQSYNYYAQRYYGSGTQYTLTITTRNATLYDYSFVLKDGLKFSDGGTQWSWTGESGWTATVTAIVPRNYVFDGWYNANGAKVSSNTTYTVTAGSTAEGTYTARATYNLATITVNISGTGGSVSGGGTYTKGTQVTLTATTPADKRFLRWSDGVTSPSRQITVTTDATYTAVYSTTYVKTATSGASGTAYVGGSGTLTQCYYAQGDSVTVRAYPANASTIGFIGWYNGNTLVSGNATYTFAFGGTSLTLTAKFATKQRTYTVVSSDDDYGTVGIHPGGYAPGESTSAGASYTAAFGERIGIVGVITDGTYDGVYRRGRFIGWYADSSYTQLLTAESVFNETVPSDYSGVTYYAKFVQAEVVTITANVSDGESIVTDRGTVSIITDAVAPGQGYYSGAITFEIAPPVGFHVAGWLINGADTEKSGNSVTLDIAANCTITAVVLENTYKVSCVVDTASTGCGECKLQTSEDGGLTWDDAESDDVTHGTLCRVLVVADLNGTSAFRRLVAGGDAVSVIQITATSWAYQFNATVGIRFVAFFGNTLQVAAKHIVEGDYADEEYGKATVSTSASDPGAEQSMDFTYGDTLYVHATNNADEEHPAYFVGWYSVTGSPPTPSESRILNMGAVAEVKPTTSSPVIYWAEFKNEREVCAVRLTNSGTTYGRLSLVVLDGAEVEEIGEEDYDDILDEHFPSSTTIVGGANDASDKYYSIPLGTRILVRCETNESLNVQFDTWKLKTHTGRHSYDSQGAPIGNGPEAEHVVAGDEVFMATYKTALPAKAILRYGDGSTFNDGTIRLSPIGSNPVRQDNFVSGDFTPDTNVTALATPRNGYAFAGWYSDQTCEDLVSEFASYTFTKAANPETLYAKFVQDENAIFVWEGDNSNKMMTWRSRRTQFAQPINLSSAAVCADGYSLQLKVAYASAPDPAADGWKEGEITIKNQDPRRLPMLRPERYVEVEVRSDKPVLRIAVASSMAGLLG